MIRHDIFIAKMITLVRSHNSSFYIVSNLAPHHFEGGECVRADVIN